MEGIDLFNLILKVERKRQLDVKVTSSTKSAVRAVIVAGNMYEDREALENKEDPRPTGAIIMLFKPPSTTFGGHGEVYQKFRETGVISGFPGEGQQPAESTDDNYEDAPLKIMNFHETFRNLKKDVNHSMY